MISDGDEAERRRRLHSKFAGWLSSSARYDGAALRADTCRQGERALSRFAPLPSTSADGGGVGWHGRTATMRTPAEQQSSSPTEVAWADTAECRRELHCGEKYSDLTVITTYQRRQGRGAEHCWHTCEHMFRCDLSAALLWSHDDILPSDSHTIQHVQYHLQQCFHSRAHHRNTKDTDSTWHTFRLNAWLPWWPIKK